MRERLISRELNPLLTSLPSKFSEIHDYQYDPIDEIVEAYLDHGEKVVVLEAPTGSGKTLIAEVVRRMIRERGVYVCHNKDLQAQFARDFPYSRVLYGRDNYIPTRAIQGATCGDCTWRAENQHCDLCHDRGACPYQVAKEEAVHSPVPVLNSAYWLNETQAPRSAFSNTGFVIFDEADTLESVMMSQVEIYVGERAQERYGICPPEKLTVDAAYVPWAEDVVERLAPYLAKMKDLDFASVQEARELKRLVNLHESVMAMKQDLDNDIPWVYTGGAGSSRRQGEVISFKPVKVDRFGAERIWTKDKRFLLMSATIVSPSELLESLGWTGNYRYVTMDSQFHAKNRQVIVKPVANVTKKGFTDEGRGALRSSVQDIIQRHAGERGVIHSVSYSLTNMLRSTCEDARPGACFTYDSASQRSRAIKSYMETDASILIAPSVERGLDLPGELCRFQVIVKVPYLSLGDKQVERRLYKTPDGKLWYQIYVARTIMQMVGRGVRNEQDYCVCYILDSSFKAWYKGWGHLFPKWFTKAIRFE